MTPKSRRVDEHALDGLARVAPFLVRWIERLLAGGEPPLTVAQYLALGAIAEGPVAAADLARRTGVSPAAVSQLVAGLDERGLVERRSEPGDRRRQALVLSPDGERALSAAAARARAGLAQVVGPLPRPEADALARSLGRIESELAGTAPPRRPPPPRGPNGPRGRSAPPPR